MDFSFLWWLLWLFYMAAYLYVVILIITDLFRDEKTSGWFKAVWVIALVFVPFLTALVYVIVNGKGMAERSAARGRATVPRIRRLPPPASATPADDIAKAKELLEPASSARASSTP